MSLLTNICRRGREKVFKVKPRHVQMYNIFNKVFVRTERRDRRVSFANYVN